MGNFKEFHGLYLSLFLYLQVSALEISSLQMLMDWKIFWLGCILLTSEFWGVGERLDIFIWTHISYCMEVWMHMFLFPYIYVCHFLEDLFKNYLHVPRCNIVPGKLETPHQCSTDSYCWVNVCWAPPCAKSCASCWRSCRDKWGKWKL